MERKIVPTAQMRIRVVSSRLNSSMLIYIAHPKRLSIAAHQHNLSCKIQHSNCIRQKKTRSRKHTSLSQLPVQVQKLLLKTSMKWLDIHRTQRCPKHFRVTIISYKVSISIAKRSQLNSSKWNTTCFTSRQVFYLKFRKMQCEENSFSFWTNSEPRRFSLRVDLSTNSNDKQRHKPLNKSGLSISLPAS